MTSVLKFILYDIKENAATINVILNKQYGIKTKQKQNKTW